ncbi:MAG: acetylxylan esterase, partial [Chitinophagaceae bacterium]|nr:acetylxylan esterase [Rubrivivax sp.]
VPQSTEAVLTITTPDAPQRLLPLGSSARFRIAFKLDPYPAEGVVVRLKLGPEQLEGAEREVRVPAEGLEVTAAPQSRPGFVRCTVSATVAGQTLRQWTTVGFAPDRIEATQTEPADFDAFWAGQKAALSRIPLDLQFTPAPELSTPRVKVSFVSFQNVGNWSGHSRFHGVLAVPVGAGPFPALLSVPGAGVRPYSGNIAMAEKGFITLQLGIHGIPVNLPKPVYDGLASGALKDYPRYELDDRFNYYYRRVYMGAYRASEVLASQPQWDGKNLLVAGGSQGGQLAIVTATLNPRITGLAANYPAYSDVSGYLHGRAGGWPGLFKPGTDGQPGDAPVAPKLLTTGYYDTVNFARRLKVPGHYAWGFNDNVTPPTSLHAAYNVITAAKQLVLAAEQRHATSPEQTARMNAWLLRQAGLPATSTNPVSRP